MTESGWETLDDDRNVSKCDEEALKGDMDPAITKRLYNIFTMLDQRRRLWANVVQMLYTCFVFAREALKKN